MNKFTVIVLVALVSVAIAAPVEQSEIAQLSKLMPCKNEQAGSRVRHPGSEHKFLRCVSRDSFWIETCPDNLFYNAELDLCDWSVITRTTTEGPDVVVKFRPILFRRNKTVIVHHRPRRPLDLSRVSVKVDQETQMFPGQEDIVDTLTPVRTGSKSSFTSRKNTGSNSFTHFKEEEEEKSVDPSEFTALPSKKMTDVVEEEEEPMHMETTTERPMRVRTTTERPMRVRTTTERPMRVRTTTERPIVRTTTERPVIVRRPVEVRPVEKDEEPREEHDREHRREHVREHRRKQDREHHDEEIFEEEPEEDQAEKAVLIRNGNIVRVTPPKKFVATRLRPASNEQFENIPSDEEDFEEVPVREEHRQRHDEMDRRPVEEVQVREEHRQRHDEMDRRPVEEVIEEVPVQEEIDFTTTTRTPFFTSTRGTFEARKHHKVPSRTQLFKQLAEEIPGARVVSFNGKPVNSQF